MCCAAASLGSAAWAEQGDAALRAAQWRAASRFGYGPPALAPQGAAQPSKTAGKAWALAELDRASQQARESLSLPPEWAHITQPLPELFALEQADRERLDAVRAKLAPGEEAPLPAAVAWVMQVGEWRLQSCSRPQDNSPLLVRLTDFWFNHLNVDGDRGVVRPVFGHYITQAIRPNVLGRYEDLLMASAKHPAMLYYLDQVNSRADKPNPADPNKLQKRDSGLNENYARELLELHTLGARAGYEQSDVRELARMLTGWTLSRTDPSGFAFQARFHDDGSKRFLGQPVAPSGVQEGEAAIRLLARHPATAQRVSLRLAQWFVADEPPPALVKRLTQRYLKTDGDLRAVMQTLIESPETWDAKNRLFKTPWDFACASLMAAQVQEPNNPAASDPAKPEGNLTTQQFKWAHQFLKAAGQPIQGWRTPDGFGTATSTWLTPEALSRRADFAVFIGHKHPNPESSAQRLAPWLSPTAWTRIQQEPPKEQMGLALASPDFMNK